MELDPFHYTKLMRKFKRWKEREYMRARNQIVQNLRPGELEPPINFNDPFLLHSFHDMLETARKRHNYLGEIYFYWRS